MFNSIYSKIRERVDRMPYGAVFSLADFEDLGDSKTVSKYLIKMSEKGTVSKVTRGIFAKLPESEEASPDDVARALARSNSWTLVPSGDTAMHLIGASEKKPSVWTYITDGTSRVYELKNCVINFTHASGRFISNMSEKTALVVQVIKAYGKKPMNSDLAKKIRSYFVHAEYERVVEESRGTTVWISEIIRTLFAKKNTGDIQ